MTVVRRDFKQEILLMEESVVVCQEHRDRFPKGKKKIVEDRASLAEAPLCFGLGSETPNILFPLLTKRGKD